MSHLENYLRELRDTRASGEAVRETSFYPALSNLLNAVGAELKPPVRAVINLRNRGAGLPDGGLFTARQLRRAGGDEALGDPKAFGGQQPERGVVEVKGAGEEVRAVAEGEQVSRYLRHYGQVLVTNLREFLLVGRGPGGEPRLLEGYALAADEAELWRLVRNPREGARAHEGRFVEYLRRALLAAAPLDAPEALAWFLASYARDAKERIEREPQALASLRNVREALEQALGLRFEGAQGEQFFRSTLVQTLFYGVFSAWVLWSKSEELRRGRERFHWHDATWTLHVPAIRTLFEQVVTPSNVRGLGLEEVLDWTADTLNRVETEKFFERFAREHAVQYFYEPFLEVFDPELRKQLGVWYTPNEIVRYMVERADRVLREELGVADGLADERVYVLDPCCGTGAYLVEVLRRIKRTLDERGGDALAAHDLKRAAVGRVFGFEILPAPFVVAHLQLGLLLQTEGGPLAEGERVGVYLTNALTGWEPPQEPKQQLPFAFHALEEERDAAEEVKRGREILVVIGNPPYNAFAGLSPEEEQGLVEPYKEGLIREWGIKKFNLDDLYVRFFRLAERRIAEMTGRGLVCFISNYSWTSEPSFVVLRKRLLEAFDKFWIENMHGNRKISEYAPDGRTSETVFAIKGFSPGIQQGVVISTWVKNNQREGAAEVLYRNDLHAAKAEERRAQLLACLNAQDFDAQYTAAQPNESNRYSFRPSNVSAQYLTWPKIDKLSSREPFNGPIERRANSLIVFEGDEQNLESLRAYLDNSVSDEEVRQAEPRFMNSSGEFKAEKVRAKLKGRVEFDASKIVKYPFKPFDIRLAYLDPELQPLFSRPAPELLEHRFEGNKFLIVRETSVVESSSPPFYFSSLVCDYHSLAVEAKHVPLFLRKLPDKRSKSNKQTSLLGEEAAAIANLSPRAREYLRALGFSDEEIDAEAGALVWYHALAVGYAPAYLEENADGIRGDFPRVPLPGTREELEASAGLGREVAALLDTEAAVAGVTAGRINPELRHVAVLRRDDGAQLDPAAGHLELRAGWGHRGRAGVVMPGKGRARTRGYTAQETAALPEAPAVWGTETHDIYLNDAAYWSNVPARVWDYHIGGYQVIKKWLSYRESELTGRPLTPAEAREVMNIARRIAALLMLEARLNENYRRAQADAYEWSAGA